MRTSLMVLCLLLPCAAVAQEKRYPFEPIPPQQSGRSTIQPIEKSTKPVTSDLEDVFNSLNTQLGTVEQLSGQLKGLSTSTPENMQTQIAGAAKVLGDLVDKLAEGGELSNQLAAVRSAAQVHRKRIDEVPKEGMTEQDRTSLMATWDKIITDADRLATKITDSRERVLNSLKGLRMRQAAMGEYILAGRFQAALNSIRDWASELDSAISRLKANINMNRPGS